jgi:DNA-binding CsgD family transcriptional regulator
MFISRYTVNDHLKSVFAKLGIHSRRELITGLFGQRA